MWKRSERRKRSDASINPVILNPVKDLGAGSRQTAVRREHASFGSKSLASGPGV